MQDLKIVKKGFFDKNRDDLISLFPEIKKGETVSILDLSETGFQFNQMGLSNELKVLVTRENQLKSEHLKRTNQAFDSNKDILIDAVEENIFDVIYLGSFLSQCIDPWKTLKKIKKSLKDSGSLLLTFPNIGNYGAIYYLLMGKWEYAEKSLLNKSHLRFFTLSEIVEMIISAGFSIEAIEANFSPHHGMIDRMAEIVEELGGSPQEFKEECQVYQYFLRVKKNVLDFTNKRKDYMKDLHEKAIKLFLAKKFQEASKCYLAILKIDEKDEKGILGLARCFEELKSTKFALKCYKRLVELYPTGLNIIEYANYHVRLENHEEVITILEPFVKENSVNLDQKDLARILKVIGNAYINTGDIDKAESYYVKAKNIFMQIGIERGVILVNLGSVEIQRSNFEKGRDYFNQAIYINEEKGKAYSGLGMIEESLGNTKKAENFFCKSLDSDPTCMISIYNLVKMAYQEKNNCLAINYIEKYLRYKPNDTDIKYTLAGLYFELMEFKKALEICDQILITNPDHENCIELRKHIERNMFGSDSNNNLSNTKDAVRQKNLEIS